MASGLPLGSCALWIPGHTAVTSSVPSSSESKHKVRPGSTSMSSIVTQLLCFSTRTCLMTQWHLCLPVSLTQAPEGPLLVPESQLLCVDESSLLPVFICRVDMCCRWGPSAFCAPGAGPKKNCLLLKASTRKLDRHSLQTLESALWGQGFCLLFFDSGWLGEHAQ